MSAYFLAIYNFAATGAKVFIALFLNRIECPNPSVSLRNGSSGLPHHHPSRTDDVLDG